MKNKALMTKLAVPEKLQPWVNEYIEWAKVNLDKVHASEVTLVSPLGYAGQMDCLAHVKGKLSVIDFKTQKYKNNKPSYWENWLPQLAAYREALPDDFHAPFARKQNPRLVSVTINSLEPAPVTHKVWTVAEARVALSTFKAALKIWQNQHKYKPKKED